MIYLFAQRNQNETKPELPDLKQKGPKNILFCILLFGSLGKTPLYNASVVPTKGYQRLRLTPPDIRYLLGAKNKKA